MGVERSVTRWYLQRQFILSEIMQLEIKLGLSSTDMTVADSTDESADEMKVGPEKIDLEAVSLQIIAARNKLKALGHCPKPMMG